MFNRRRGKLRKSELFRKAHHFLELVRADFDFEINQLIAEQLGESIPAVSKNRYDLILNLGITNSEFDEPSLLLRQKIDSNHGQYKTTSSGLESLLSKEFLTLADEAEKEEDERQIRKSTIRRQKIESYLIWFTFIVSILSIIKFGRDISQYLQYNKHPMQSQQEYRE